MAYKLATPDVSVVNKMISYVNRLKTTLLENYPDDPDLAFENGCAVIASEFGGDIASQLPQFYKQPHAIYGPDHPIVNIEQAFDSWRHQFWPDIQPGTVIPADAKAKRTAGRPALSEAERQARAEAKQAMRQGHTDRMAKYQRRREHIARLHSELQETRLQRNIAVDKAKSDLAEFIRNWDAFVDRKREEVRALESQHADLYTG